MTSRHRRTLEAVFRDPVSGTLVWADIERMLVHYGATVRERRGSRILLTLAGRNLVVHRPHPAKEARTYVVRRVRELLIQAGVTPWE